MPAKFFTSLAICLFIAGSLLAQTIAASEDSLNNDLSKNSTSIGGYGNAFYQRNSNLGSSKLDLERFVIFTGHKFNSKISIFSELEVEDAKVTGGEGGGEVAIEQAYLKFNLSASQYVVAGLFIPRLGILNENHLPNTFNGNERNQVETVILPSTWRELGVGLYGNLNNLPVNYSVAFVNGLNSAGFQHGSGIREGRFEGRNATGNNLAVTAAVQFYAGNLKAQLSGYYGGTVGVSKLKADSLGLNSGIFGTPVAIGEGDIQYATGAISFRILGTVVSIPDAGNINNAYANNTPKTEYGAYAEMGYDILYSSTASRQQQCIIFIRDEKLNMNASVPINGLKDNTLDQNYVIAGVTYLPIRNVAVKADISIIHTGHPGVQNYAFPYQANNNLVNIGVAFSF